MKSRDLESSPGTRLRAKLGPSVTETAVSVMQSDAKRCDPAYRRPEVRTGNGRDGANTTVAPLYLRGLPAPPSRSCRFSLSAIPSTTKCRGALAPAFQAAPALLTLIDPQIVRRQSVSLATMGWDFLPPDFATIDIVEVNDRRTISREQAPATNLPL